ncbi:hypothetical protein CVT25_013479 [Psilocybe cyanescens]|uniref:Fungal-type protein kinase domain-containing protein n=1 Tax=Psilocybe cyanescens TaxID=93625 RepID=A0A409WTM0_PSICY|nr:hypothetical protein CVT25_013479 [Psilocybe cyanescens]
MISSSDCSAIKIDLKGKIEYDDTNIFKRLRLDSIDNRLVQKCVVAVLKTQKEDVDQFQKLIMSASAKSEEELELDSKLARDKARQTDSRYRKTEDEYQMCEPLARIFTAIANFNLPGNCTQGPTRLFHSMDDMMLEANEPHTFRFSVPVPDFEISPCGIDFSTSKLWRDRDVFGQVKSSRKQGPNAALPNTIPNIISHCADYARLFMSGRPFMLYCTGLLIFGSQFCVGIFDRDGITFSPIHDMFTETEIFVHVIRAITHELTIQELGFDPTVCVLSDEETSQLTGETKGGYLSAIISHIGSNLRLWCTIGPPMWTSVSLLGRGTAVWHTSWCSSARNRESDIYQAIQQPIEGLAKFECRGDVYFMDGKPITVRNLRNLSSHKDLGDIDSELKNPTPVLHRLVLATVGKPLWQYESEIELLTGFCDALLGHKALYEQGILHRDISAGNVLLSTAQDEKFHRFITDLDFAYVTDDMLVI